MQHSMSVLESFLKCIVLSFLFLPHRYAIVGANSMLQYLTR